MSPDRLAQVDCRGDDRQRGVAQGSALRHRLPDLYDSLARLPVEAAWLPGKLRRSVARLAVGAAGRLYLPLHRRLLRRHAAGGLWQRLAGLAEGFDVSAAEVYGFHAFEVESGIVGFRMGCTAVAVGPEQSAVGAPRLAYNHDFPTAFGPHLVLRRTLGHGPGVARSLSVTYEVLVGAIAGVNEHGLAATVNQAFARAPARWRPGLLPSLLVQDCLDHCRTVDEAVHRAQRLPTPVGSLLTLVDASGDRAVVELAPAGHSVRRPHRSATLLVAFNGYRCRRTREQEVPRGAWGTGLAGGYELHRANLERERRFGELLGAHTGPWSDADLHRLLSDHDGAPGANSLCRHDPALGGDTIASALIDPVQRTVRVRRGFPCRGDWPPPVAL